MNDQKKVKSGWHRLRCGVTVIACVLAAAGAAAEPDVGLRAMVSSFSIDENSFRSYQAARSFSDLLQAELSRATELAWVERDELERVIAEQTLGAAGALDTSSTLRLGRLLKANLLLKGDFERAPEVPGWRLRLEVVDVTRADVLAETNALLTGAADAPLTWTPADLARATAAAAHALKAAESRAGALRGKVFLAPLFFRHLRAPSRLDFYARDLMGAMHALSRREPDVHCARFPRVAACSQEAELAFAGLAGDDAEVSRAVADYYVWGEYEEVGSEPRPWNEVRVRLQVSVWDGCGPAARFERTAGVPDLTNLCEWAQSQVLGAVRRGKGDRQESASAEIASQLVTWATEMLKQAEASDRPGARERHAYELFSLAAFFDPGNRTARWRVALWRKLAQPPFFWTMEPVSDEWRRLCEAFGFVRPQPWLVTSETIHGDNGFGMYARSSDGRLYIDLAQQMLLIVRNARETPGGTPYIPGRWCYAKTRIPPDVPDGVLQAWEERLAREYVRRLRYAALRAPWDINLLDEHMRCIFDRLADPALCREAIESVWPVVNSNPPADAPLTGREIFDELWVARPLPKEWEERLKAAYAQAGSAAGADRLLAGRRAPPVPRPMSPELESELRRRFALPKRSPYATNNTEATLGKLVSPTIKEVAIGGGGPLLVTKANRWATVAPGVEVFDPTAVAIAYGANRVWFAVTNTVYGYATRGDTHGVVVARLPFVPTSLVFAHSNLWFTCLRHATYEYTPTEYLPDYVKALDLASMEVRAFDGRDGVATHNLRCSCRAGDRVFFGGAGLCSYSARQAQWTQYPVPPVVRNNVSLANPAIWRLAAGKGIIAVQLVADRVRDAGAEDALLVGREAGGEWTDVSWSLIGHPANRDWCIRSGGEPSLGVVAMATDSEGLWVVSTRGILLLNTETLAWGYKQILPFQLTTACFDGDDVWLGGVGETLSFDARDPTGPWLDDVPLKCFVLRFHRPTRTWGEQFGIPHPGGIAQIACADGRMWLRLGSGLKMTAYVRGWVRANGGIAVVDLPGKHRAAEVLP